MENEYVYLKERRNFGRQCRFKTKHEVLISEEPNNELLANYILKDPVPQGVQECSQLACNEINTDIVPMIHCGINHEEGGWPENVNVLDPDAIIRYKKRVLRSEQFQHSLRVMATNVEKALHQNNAISIYDEYFEANSGIHDDVHEWRSKTLNVFKDQELMKRPIWRVSFEPNNGTHIVCSHADKEWRPDGLSPYSNDSYIWDMKFSDSPVLILKPPSAATCIEYNHLDISMLASGTMNGQICLWDTRRGCEPTIITEREISHRGVVNDLVWMASKSCYEFFTAGHGGFIKWWDSRNLHKTIDSLIIDPIKSNEQDVRRAHPATVLEYESTIPTKFMVGTEFGYVFVCNRRGKTPMEQITMRIQYHMGPVRALQRNAAYPKYYLSVGDWRACIGCEDVMAPIYWTNYQEHQIMDGTWSPTNFPMYFTCLSNGSVQVWDILEVQKEPALVIKLCDEPLVSLKAHESGNFIVSGSQSGAAFLIQLDDNMKSCDRNRRINLNSMFEREMNREKVVESKMREIMLKARQKDLPTKSNDDIYSDLNDVELNEEVNNESEDEVDEIKVAETEFFKSANTLMSELFLREDLDMMEEMWCEEESVVANQEADTKSV